MGGYEPGLRVERHCCLTPSLRASEISAGEPLHRINSLKDALTLGRMAHKVVRSLL
jgi:hypothetical protein